MNIVIGNTSQLYNYFKEYDNNLIGISSRNIDISIFKKMHFDSAFILFGEARTFIDGDLRFYANTNVDYTLKVINLIKSFVNKIIVYSTSEIWNKLNGPINLDSPKINTNSPYIQSKLLMEEALMSIDSDVRIVYPFNFNSPYRKQNFLYSKFLDVILNQNKINIGNIDINRDIVHPKLVVEGSYNVQDRIIVGSGKLINLRSFYMDLLAYFKLQYEDFVYENNDIFKNERNEYYFETTSIYNKLLEDTIYDIEKYKHTLN